MKYFRLGLVFSVLSVAGAGAQAPQTPKTEITKWPDGRLAAVAITYDDSTINQFRIALPLMNERGLVGTFFVITGQIPGSKNMPTFVGRPIMDILKESATVPTSKDNVLERTSMLRYLTEVQREEILVALRPAPAPNNLASVDGALAKLRESGKTFTVGAVPYVQVRSEEAQPCAGAVAKPTCFAGRVRADGPGALSWDEFRKAAAQGHEFANHAVSHARLPSLDEANILYEVDKAKEELKDKMGEKHLFSIEAPYGIDDDRVRQVLINRFPLTRNWVSDSDGEFMDGIMRGDKRDPAKTTKPYMEWERGPVTATTIDEMKGWVDTSLQTGTWLVLVIHGLDGIGYQPLPVPNVTAFFDYMKTNRDSGKLWVATYQDGAKYIRERMKSQIATKQDGQAIEVTVTNAYDPKVYDVPLTARTTVPAGWAAAQIKQGKDTQKVQVQKDATGSFVQYHVLPNAGPARIEKG
jgi:peptidoglycan/xylan/chitin deacetylase (PgdA/CDA1 family)